MPSSLKRHWIPLLKNWAYSARAVSGSNGNCFHFRCQGLTLQLLRSDRPTRVSLVLVICTILGGFGGSERINPHSLNHSFNKYLLSTTSVQSTVQRIWGISLNKTLKGKRKRERERERNFALLGIKLFGEDRFKNE